MSMQHHTITIHSILPTEALANTDAKPVSAGLHPWYIGADWEVQFDLLTSIAQEQRVVMIGEAGLDKVCQTDFELQKEVFLQQSELAEQLRKPLIIHCVKAWQEMMAFHKTSVPSVPWIIHGFRGKPELAEQLLAEGFYLSFGEHFNAESVRRTPLNRLCTETDESPQAIEDIYSAIAEIKGCTTEELIQNANQALPYWPDCYIDIHAHLLNNELMPGQQTRQSM